MALRFRIPIISRIPDSSSKIPCSKSQDSAFHNQIVLQFRYPNYLTWGETTVINKQEIRDSINSFWKKKYCSTIRNRWLEAGCFITDLLVLSSITCNCVFCILFSWVARTTTISIIVFHWYDSKEVLLKILMDEGGRGRSALPRYKTLKRKKKCLEYFIYLTGFAKTWQEISLILYLLTES